MQPFESLSIAEQEARLLELARRALPAWGLAGELRLIKQRENAVYELRTADGTRYALRVHRGGYHDDDELRSESQWLQALAQSGIAVPEVLPTRDGALFTHVDAPGIPQTRQVDLLAWCDGEPLGSVEDGLPADPATVQRIFFTIGQVMARMHAQASGWIAPAGFRRHAWDVEGLVGEQPFWGRFWELEALTEAQRATILGARARVEAGLRAIGQPADQFSLIHADCVPENLLVDGETVYVIDFDDAGYGWHLFDIATALYFVRGDPAYDVAHDSLIAGYRSVRALDDATLAQLPLFTAARSFTYLGWVHTRRKTQTAQEMTPILMQMCLQACAALD